jgi:hypothetical protein
MDPCHGRTTKPVIQVGAWVMNRANNSHIQSVVQSVCVGAGQFYLGTNEMRSGDQGLASSTLG